MELAVGPDTQMMVIGHTHDYTHICTHNPLSLSLLQISYFSSNPTSFLVYIHRKEEATPHPNKFYVSE